jgi:hypothetical protein
MEARFNLPCCFRIGEHRRATSLSFDAVYAPGASAAIGAILNNTSDIEHKGCQTGTAFGISVRLMPKKIFLFAAWSASRGGPVRKEPDMVAHPDGMRPRSPFAKGGEKGDLLFRDRVPFFDKEGREGFYDTDQGRW